jgi:hypothetical protein
LDVSPFKRTPQPPSSLDVAPSDFFSVGWKPSLNGGNIMGKMNSIWSGGWNFDNSLSRNDRNRFYRLDESLQRFIDGNGDYVSENITSEFLNWIKQWQACQDRALMDNLYVSRCYLSKTRSNTTIKTYESHQNLDREGVHVSISISLIKKINSTNGQCVNPIENEKAKQIMG